MATFTPVPSFSTVPSFQAVPFVSGFRQTVVSTTTFTVMAGFARALCNNNIIQFPSTAANGPGVITVDITTVGANGCFPVSIASLGLTANTLFPVYICSNSSGTGLGTANPIAGGTTTNTSSIVIVATGNNFLPAGYDTFHRIGWCPIAHATSHIIPYTQSGHGNEKTYMFQDPITGVSGGAATAQTVIDLTSGDGLIPPNISVNVFLNAAITPNAAGGYVSIEPGNLTAASVAPIQVFGSATGEPNSSCVQVIATPNASTGDANIQYFVNNAGSSATVNVVGFVDSLGNSLV